MELKILLPFKIFATETDVIRIVAETYNGYFGLLPQRLDCIAPLVPGILIYEIKPRSEVFVAIDEGILIKTGRSVFVTVRNAIRGKNLIELRKIVIKDFMKIDEKEKNFSLVMEKMESDFIRRLVEFHHGQ